MRNPMQLQSQQKEVSGLAHPSSNLQIALKAELSIRSRPVEFDNLALNSANAVLFNGCCNETPGPFGHGNARGHAHRITMIDTVHGDGDDFVRGVAYLF